jgi:hypothetical protein
MMMEHYTQLFYLRTGCSIAIAEASSSQWEETTIVNYRVDKWTRRFGK